MPNLPWAWNHEYQEGYKSSNKREKDEELSRGRSPIRISRSASRKRSRTPNEEINFTLSEHAKKRMQERDIRNKDIERILKTKPEVEKTRNPLYKDVNVYKEYKPEQKKFELKVVTSQDKIPKIITVIKNTNKKGGKTRKKKNSKNANKKNKTKIIKLINKKKNSLKSKKLEVKKLKKSKKKL